MVNACSVAVCLALALKVVKLLPQRENHLIHWWSQSVTPAVVATTCKARRLVVLNAQWCGRSALRTALVHFLTPLQRHVFCRCQKNADWWFLYLITHHQLDHRSVTYEQSMWVLNAQWHGRSTVMTALSCMGTWSLACYGLDEGHWHYPAIWFTL